MIPNPLTWIFLLGCLFLNACSSISKQPAKTGFTILEAAADQGLGPASEQRPFFYTFSRGGIRRQALVLIPGVVFEAPMKALGSAPKISLWVGMPFQMGDGAELIVESISESGSSGEIVRLFLDPIHRRQDRQWQRLEIRVPSETRLLRWRVSPGPAGDAVADWVGLAPATEQDETGKKQQKPLIIANLTKEGDFYGGETI